MDARKLLTLRLGEALHRNGASAPRVEHAMRQCSARFGLEGQFFATPTSIFASFGVLGEQSTALLRVEPGSIDLERRCALDELIAATVAGELEPADGLRRLDAIHAAPQTFGPLLNGVCFALASSCAARFFGGGWRDVVAATAVGAAVGVLALLAPRARLVERLFEPLAALVAAALAALAAVWLGPLSSYTVTVAGLIMLVPGLMITTALNELATRHLAAGTARFMGSLLTFVLLAFGVALGRRAGDLLPPAPEGPPELPQAWTLWPALLVAPLCFGVLLRARPRDFPLVLAAGVLAFWSARAGSVLLGPELGAFVGAACVGVGSNLLARWARRPSVVVLLPGLLMLVPGSIGFRSLASLLEQDVVAGVGTAFTMLLVAIALVAGLLLASVVVPPRNADPLAS